LSFYASNCHCSILTLHTLEYPAFYSFSSQAPHKGGRKLGFFTKLQVTTSLFIIVGFPKTECETEQSSWVFTLSRRGTLTFVTSCCFTFSGISSSSSSFLPNQNIS